MPIILTGSSPVIMIESMPEKPKPAPVVKFTPRPSDLEKRIKEIAKDSSNVRWQSKSYGTHAESRIEWRDITDKMMFDVLRTGYIKGEVVPGENSGEWKAKMTKQMKGRREVGVVTIVIRNERLFIKTVEWEDVS